MTPANTSCDVLNTGPGVATVTFGSTSVSVVSATSTAKAALAPSSWNPCS